MNEARFRSMVVSMVADFGGQVTPIETAASAGEGVPDVELCYVGGRQAWLELKVAPYKVRSQTVGLTHFRRLQARWLRDRWRLGGACGLLIRCEEVQGSAMGFALLDGEDASQLFLADPNWTWEYIQGKSYLPNADLDGGKLKMAIYSLSISASYGQRP